jgi:hypothetical protein
MQQLAKAAPGQTTARAVSIANTSEPRLGDARVAYSVDARADSDSSSEVGVTATLVVIRIGRAILGATFSGAPAPPVDAVEQVLLPAARRLAKTQRPRSR